MTDKMTCAGCILLMFLAGCASTVGQVTAPMAEDLPEAQPTYLTNTIPHNTGILLEPRMVRKEIYGMNLTLFGYNGQVPGLGLRVKQGRNLTIILRNRLDLPTTVHWHGLRVENKYDGVPGLTQETIVKNNASSDAIYPTEPVPANQRFLYVLDFPDPGVYWYHPHVREGFQREHGLYGAIVVEPADPSEYSEVYRDDVLFLDDIKLDENGIEPFLEKDPYATMGRFGNQMFINGQEQYALEVPAGSIMRFYLINAANARTFNFSIKDKQLKVIGSDLGFYEKEFFADSIMLSPGERAIVEVLFDKPGSDTMLHTSPLKSYTLGRVNVNGGGPADNPLFSELRTHDNDARKLADQFSRAPDLEIQLSLEQGSGGGHNMHAAAPMEWEDTSQTPTNTEGVHWMMRDLSTGKANEDMTYRVKVGDVRKIRFHNKGGTHVMQHPMHMHGQRFLVLDPEGKNDNLVWKDTVNVPAGESLDILVEFTSPGKWMFHCHIAEHIEAGMMTTIEVIP